MGMEPTRPPATAVWLSGLPSCRSLPSRVGPVSGQPVWRAMSSASWRRARLQRSWRRPAMLRHVAIVLSVAYNGVGTTPPVPAEAALGGPTAVWLEYDRLKRTAFMMTGALEHLAHSESARRRGAGLVS